MVDDSGVCVGVGVMCTRARRGLVVVEVWDRRLGVSFWLSVYFRAPRGGVACSMQYQSPRVAAGQIVVESASC